ncbi:MAG: hypothetical protein J2P46_10390 [Zavarzinella sp.]|nr:hypothetical protein [Zavarzinella sp.]
MSASNGITRAGPPRAGPFCFQVIARSARRPVGVVGLREHRDEIVALHPELPENVYLSINAYKRRLA